MTGNAPVPADARIASLPAASGAASSSLAATAPCCASDAGADAERLRAAVLEALGDVVDPELDEPLTDLGFVERVDATRAGDVVIRLRLPTFWCSPSFAFLMAHDARVAALRVPDVRQVRLELIDHGQSDEISDGISDGRTFADVFPYETDGDIEELRRLFDVKAFGMRQEQLVRALLGDGMTAAEIVALPVDNVFSGSQVVRRAAPLVRMYLDRRARLHLTSATLITDERGAPIRADDLEAHLKRTRRQRVSMTFNASMCRGLLETRYGLASSGKEDSTR